MPQLEIPALFFRLTGIFMVSHFLLALVASAVLASDEAAVSEIFSLPAFGSLVTREPYLMRTKFFLPWVLINSIAGQPPWVRALVWSARLGGTAFLLSLVGTFSAIAYVAVGA